MQIETCTHVKKRKKKEIRENGEEKMLQFEIQLLREILLRVCLSRREGFQIELTAKDSILRKHLCEMRHFLENPV